MLFVQRSHGRPDEGRELHGHRVFIATRLSKHLQGANWTPLKEAASTYDATGHWWQLLERETQHRCQAHASTERKGRTNPYIEIGGQG